MIQSREPDLAERCIRIWLEGIPRDEIARQLGISEGSVVNIVDYYSQNDTSIPLQRQIALSIKKRGTDVFQLASDIRFVNALKRRSANVKVIEEFLSELQKEIDLGVITQQQAIDAIVNISEAGVQEKTPINNIFQRIQDGYAEVERAKSEMAQQKKELENSKIQVENALLNNQITIETVRNFRMTKRKLRKRGLSFRDAERTEQTLNVIANLKSLGFDVQKIVDKFSKIASAKDELRKLHGQCDELSSYLDDVRISADRQKKQWGNFAKGVEDYGAAMQMGLKPEHLLAAAAIFHKHIYNFTPDQILSDIEKYGNLHAAVFRLKLELNKLQTQGSLV